MDTSNGHQHDDDTMSKKAAGAAGAMAGDAASSAVHSVGHTLRSLSDKQLERHADESGAIAAARRSLFELGSTAGASLESESGSLRDFGASLARDPRTWAFLAGAYVGWRLGRTMPRL